MKRHDDWLIIGGDHNASVGKLERKLRSTKARGKYGCRASNEAGRDLITRCEMNGMTWAIPLRVTLTEGNGFIKDMGDGMK